MYAQQYFTERGIDAASLAASGLKAPHSRGCGNPGPDALLASSHLCQSQNRSASGAKFLPWLQPDKDS